MGGLRNLSIKWKLKLIIMLTSGIALLFASGTLMYRDIITARKTIRNDLSSLARVIGMNSVGAIVFNDQQTAENNLAALQTLPDVMSACIYDTGGQVFATYFHAGADDQMSMPLIREPGYYYIDNDLLVFTPILQEKSVIGTLCIRYDLKRTQRETLQSAGIFGGIVAIAFVIIWVLSSWLQKFVSNPILGLTEVARVVSEKRDFSVRAEKQANDEIGVLIDVFNAMLAAIQFRDEKLQEYREHLEEQVAKRTNALRKANRMLQTAKEAAESANRAKSEFLANMSHEIRTPLNTVLGFADLMASLIKDKKQRSYLAAISSSGKALLNLINGILDLSKIEAGKMELEYAPVNPHTVFDEIRNIFALQASEKKIDFIVHLEQDLPTCLMLDEVRLKQILFNLIGNAVKFTENGFIRITVEKRALPHDPDAVDLFITVKDTGIGIPQQYQKEIFEAFKQKDGQSTKRYGGTGLGLSITKRLVEMMGGTISIHSVENDGSQFSISIPHVQMAASKIKADIMDTFDPEEIVFDPATVLIADDVATNRILIKEFFSATQLAAMEAENGEQAVLLSQKHQPDLILMDLKMPVMSGLEAMQKLGRGPQTQSIPVIALTASGMEEEREKMIEMGFAGYLAKPIQKATLFRELCRFIGHSRKKIDPPIDPAITLGQADITHLPLIIELLENKFMSLWYSIRKNLFFEEIGDFARQICDLGQQSAIPGLKTYGEDLGAHVESYDVENMTIVLNAYPRLVATIKSLCAQKAEEDHREQQK